MLRKKTIIACALLIIGLIFWFVGDYLQNIYGLDPPYYYIWTGLFLQLVGFLCILFIGFAFLFAALFKAKKQKIK